MAGGGEESKNLSVDDAASGYVPSSLRHGEQTREHHPEAEENELQPEDTRFLQIRNLGFWCLRVLLYTREPALVLEEIGLSEHE